MVDSSTSTPISGSPASTRTVVAASRPQRTAPASVRVSAVTPVRKYRGRAPIGAGTTAATAPARSRTAGASGPHSSTTGPSIASTTASTRIRNRLRSATTFSRDPSSTISTTSSRPDITHSRALIFPCGDSRNDLTTDPGAPPRSWLKSPWRNDTASGPDTRTASWSPVTTPAPRRSARYSAVTSPND